MPQVAPSGVRILPSIPGQVHMVAIDTTGETIVELSVVEHIYSQEFVAQMERWLEQYDVSCHTGLWLVK